MSCAYVKDYFAPFSAPWLPIFSPCADLLSDDQKEIVRTLYTSGFDDLLLYRKEEGSNKGDPHGLRMAIDFHAGPDGDWSRIYRAYAKLHDSWPGGLGLGIKGNQHLHVDTGGLWRTVEKPRWLEPPGGPASYVYKHINENLYRSMLDDSRRDFPDTSKSLPEKASEILQKLSEHAAPGWDRVLTYGVIGFIGWKFAEAIVKKRL